MKPDEIVLAIEVRFTPPGGSPANLGDVLCEDSAEDYLYDQVCTWLWRYMPQRETASDFDVMVLVTNTEP